MKTQPHKSTKRHKAVDVITLGCSKNLVDSENLYTQLSNQGIQVSHDNPEPQARTVVVNTCGFIDQAKEESIQVILEQAARKQQGELDKLVVMGCLSERYRDDLQAELPEVDAFFGTRELPQVLDTLGADYRHELLGERRTFAGGHSAYLKIAEGCDRPCAFCAIPLMRGGHRSRSIESLVEEAQFLASRGVREIMLIAQDLTYYGLDLYGKRELPRLLQALAQAPGLAWIRLHYAFPAGFPVEVLPVMASAPQICNYLDMPLQHAADPVLKRMRRGMGRTKMLELLAHIREVVPQIALRTTLLVGFPGETERDVQDLLDFVRQVRFERLGVFTYSHEEGTHAAQYPDDVPPEEKQRRADALMELQQEISLEQNQLRVNRVLPVLIDSPAGQPGAWLGRTEWDSPEVDNEVLVSSPHALQPGQFHAVRITDATDYDLYGHVEQPEPLALEQVHALGCSGAAAGALGG